MNHPMYEPNPAAEALCAARDEIARLFAAGNLLDRDAVLAVLRRRIDAATPDSPLDAL